MKRRTYNAVRRLQRGTEDLQLGQLPPDKRLVGPKEAAGLYDPGRGTPSQERDFAEEERMNELRKSVYGTVGVQINGQEMEVPLWNKDMTPAQAEDAARMRLEWGLHPFTPDSELEAKQNAAGQGPDNANNLPKPNGYKRGTSSVKKKYAKGTDTVDAKLTPREAVLNRNAAELLGRDAIARLNAHGNMLAKRGVDLASLPSDPTPGPSTENMLGYQMGTSNVQHDDTADLLREADNAFWGGGQPPPSPTPTPVPQKYKRGTSMVMMGYQYGTEDVRRMRMNAASRISSRISPVEAQNEIGIATGTLRNQGFTDREIQQAISGVNQTHGPEGIYGGLNPPGPGTYYNARRYADAPLSTAIRASANLRQAWKDDLQYNLAANPVGTLPPDQNPAYQAALRNNPTPAQRYAQRGAASLVGTYQGDFGPRAVVSTGTNSFRTYDPQGGYIGRTGNAADYLNKQFSSNPSNPVQPAAAATNPAPVVNTPNVVTTPTSLTVNTPSFQPQGLEANPFAGAPIQLDIQPRRYSDLY